MADDPFDVLDLVRTVRVRLAEIRQDRFIRPFSDRRADHFIVRRIFPALVMALMADGAFRRTDELRLIDVRPIVFLCYAG
jgi:hypothetical protein